MTNAIQYAVIQSGYAVYGAGATKDDAIAVAAQWLEDADHRQGTMTEDEVRALLKPTHSHVDGDLVLIGSDHPDFDSYLENQGGFEKRGNEWFNDD